MFEFVLELIGYLIFDNLFFFISVFVCTIHALHKKKQNRDEEKSTGPDANELLFDQKGRAHSSAYKTFMQWRDMMRGGRTPSVNYSPGLLDELFDWERAPVEKLIFEKVLYSEFYPFYAKYFAPFFPFLKEFNWENGMEIALGWYGKNSDFVMTVAPIIYEGTMKAKFINLMLKVYKKSAEQEIVSIIAKCTPSKAAFDALAYIYVNDITDTSRLIACYCMLMYKGYAIKKPDENRKKLMELFKTYDMNARKELTKKLANGQALIEGLPVPKPWV